MAASLLPDRLAQIVHDHEMIAAGEIIARAVPERVETTVGGMMNLDRRRMEREKRAKLIECHALPGENLTRQDRVRELIEHIVLRECVVGLIFRARRRRRVQSVEHHYDARNAAIGVGLLGHKIVGNREIGLARGALKEEFLALFGIERRQIVRPRQSLRALASRAEAKGKREQSNKAAGCYHHHRSKRTRLARILPQRRRHSNRLCRFPVKSVMA
jgi:hypothetical protein